jgi:hypothetical protein
MILEKPGSWRKRVIRYLVAIDRIVGRDWRTVGPRQVRTQVKGHDHLVHLQAACAVIGDRTAVGAAACRPDTHALSQRGDTSGRVDDHAPGIHTDGHDLGIAVFEAWNLPEYYGLVLE